jgi:hypothetical protein
MMRRMLLVLTVAALMAAMMALTVSSAFAASQGRASPHTENASHACAKGFPNTPENQPPFCRPV